MNLGIETLKKLNIDILNINNECDLDSNVDKIVSAILGLLGEK